MRHVGTLAATLLLTHVLGAAAQDLSGFIDRANAEVQQAMLAVEQDGAAAYPEVLAWSEAVEDEMEALPIDGEDTIFWSKVYAVATQTLRGAVAKGDPEQVATELEILETMLAEWRDSLSGADQGGQPG